MYSRKDLGHAGTAGGRRGGPTEIPVRCPPQPAYDCLAGAGPGGEVPPNARHGTTYVWKCARGHWKPEGQESQGDRASRAAENARLAALCPCNAGGTTPARHRANTLIQGTVGTGQRPSHPRVGATGSPAFRRPLAPKTVAKTMCIFFLDDTPRTVRARHAQPVICARPYTRTYAQRGARSVEDKVRAVGQMRTTHIGTSGTYTRVLYSTHTQISGLSGGRTNASRSKAHRGGSAPAAHRAQR